MEASWLRNIDATSGGNQPSQPQNSVWCGLDPPLEAKGFLGTAGVHLKGDMYDMDPNPAQWAPLQIEINYSLFEGQDDIKARSKSDGRFKYSEEYLSLFESASDWIKQDSRAFSTGNAQEAFLKVDATYFWYISIIEGCCRPAMNRMFGARDGAK
ncbi:hypothetical protein C8J57DRAFT_1633294 [Mycena rebaudengoi]|nr:hypothetical protein C8J57DRAFT_1633294 [Mycena rebaudengoi]